MKKFIVLAVLVMGCLHSLAAPESKKENDSSFVEVEKPKAEKRVVYKKRETHKFGGLNLKGEIRKPDLDYVYKRKGIRQEKIVNIPETFNNEIIQGTGQF